MVFGSQGHDPIILPPGIEPRYPWYRRLSGPQVRPGQVDERKVCFPQQGSNPGRPHCNESLYCYVLPANCSVDCDVTEYELYVFGDFLSAVNSSYRRTHELLMWE
jgi:hypothetical protein